MFGHKWQEGEGTVRETRVSRFGPGDNSPIVTHYVIDVQPSSGEPFRTQVREPFTAGAFHAPIVGGRQAQVRSGAQGGSIRPV